MFKNNKTIYNQYYSHRLNPQKVDIRELWHLISKSLLFETEAARASASCQEHLKFRIKEIKAVMRF